MTRTGQEIQEEILNTIRNSQAAVTEAIQTWASTVRSITPPMPDLNVPYADQLPKPSELVGSAYDFAEQLLASQRKFAEDVLAATQGIAPATDEPRASSGKAGSSAK